MVKEGELMGREESGTGKALLGVGGRSFGFSSIWE